MMVIDREESSFHGLLRNAAAHVNDLRLSESSSSILDRIVVLRKAQISISYEFVLTMKDSDMTV